MTECGLFSVGPSLTLDGHVLFGPPVWCPREEARRILVSSSGTYSVRSDRVAPDSLHIFRGLFFTIPRRELATRFTEIFFIAIEASRLCLSDRPHAD